MKKELEINKTDYWLPEELVESERAVKTRILISDTYMTDINHIERVKLSGLKNAPHYTVDKQGNIYQHMENDRVSNLIDSIIDKHVVVISLTNLNWLKFVYKDNKIGKYQNAFGIDCKAKDVFEYEYRGFRFWDKYTTKQISSLKRLIKQVAQENNLNGKVFNRPSIIENQMDFKNYEVIGRANINSMYTDPSPKFFDYF